MDRLLDKPRNTPWHRLRRKILTGIILLAVVFGIGALPPAFVFFMQGRSGEEQGAASKGSFGSTAEMTPELRARRDRPVAFINVNVVPMDREAVVLGQTVVVMQGIVTAVEAVEGTDAAIRRAGEIAGEGAVVVKLAKPGQDLRLDLPTIGVTTIETMREAGARALVLEAGRTLLLEPESVVRAANAAGIAIRVFGSAEQL